MKQILSKIERVGNKIDKLDFGDRFDIVLEPNNVPDDAPSKMKVGGKYAIQVKKYMTQPSTPTFDFQDKWNDGQPMPSECMQGTVLKETRGMFYMRLRTADGASWGGWVIKSAIINWEVIN